MGEVALLFAGQGAQYPGMGKDFYEQNPAAREVFTMLEQQRPGTMLQCFSGGKEELSLTLNTQPCLFAVDYAIARAVEQAGIPAAAAAGFSLGEIPALAFAGLLELEQAFALVCHRAAVMQQASEQHPGSMQAILKLPVEHIVELAALYSDVFPVNYNSPEQTAVAGNPEQLQAFAADVKAAGSKRRFSQPLYGQRSRSLDRICADSERAGRKLYCLCQLYCRALYSCHSPGIYCQSGESSGAVGANHSADAG